MPENDEFTLSLLTNDEVIAVDQHSTNNRQVSNENNHIVWIADVPNSDEKYLAIFNATPAPPARGRRRGRGAQSAITPAPATDESSETKPAEISVSLEDLGLSGKFAVRDLWTHKDLGTVTEKITAIVNSHGAVLYRIKPTQ